MADPKNKWDQPAAPPAPMFFGKKERDLVKQVNDELSERIIGQPIAYYPISIDDSNFNETYGEAIEKVSLPPVRVYAYVEVESDQTNEIYGYEYQTKLKVYFSEKRISADQNLYVRVGDFVQYGDFYYEIVRSYDDTRYYFGQVEHKFQVAVDCVRARQGAFRVMPSVTRPTERERVANNAQSPAPRAAPYPPLAASYVTVTADSKLPNERVLTAGTGITITDGGANSAVTIAASGQNAVGPTSSLQIQAGAGVFTGSANFLFVPATNVLTLAGTANITGTLSASSTISAASVSSSLFNLIPTTGSKAGPGSFLVLDTNNNVVLTTGGGGGGSGDGIFTVLNSSNAYVTSSLAIGGTTAPDHKIAVSGSVSASVNISASAFYGETITVGTLIGGSPLAISASAINLTGNVNFGSNAVISSSTNISASAFYGDASRLTNLPAGGLLSAINGSSAYLTSSLALGGTTAADHGLSISGSVSASVNVSASAFYGSGTGLTGISADGVDVTSSAANLGYNLVFTEGFQSDGSIGLGGNAALTFNPSTAQLRATGLLSASAGLTGSAVKSDGVVQGGALVSTGALSASSTLSVGSNASIAGHLTASVGLSGSTVQTTILSSSYFSLLPTSGSMGGPSSYLALDTNNQLIITGSGGSTPGGSTTQIQFNNASSFGGSANLTFNGTTLTGSYTGSLAEVSTLSSSALLTQGGSYLSGGLVHKRTAIATTHTASVTEYILGVTAVPTEILFDATAFTDGQVLVIKDESGAASTSSTILLNASASQTIDGAADVSIESPYGSVLLYSNGSNWFIY
jgi:hypothetical protein